MSCDLPQVNMQSTSTTCPPFCPNPHHLFCICSHGWVSPRGNLPLVASHIILGPWLPPGLTFPTATSCSFLQILPPPYSTLDAPTLGRYPLPLPKCSPTLWVCPCMFILGSKKGERYNSINHRANDPCFWIFEVGENKAVKSSRGRNFYNPRRIMQHRTT